MILAVELKPNETCVDSAARPSFFFLPTFGDESEREQMLGQMPIAESITTKSPHGMPTYLASLWNTPLLTAEQEYHCFQKLNYLKYLSERSNRLALTDIGCAMMLAERNRYDQQSFAVRNQIVEANLRLVISLAKKYARYGSNEFDEMVGVSNAALLRAVDLFDFRRGLRFSTYAFQAIRHSIFTLFQKEGRLKTRFISEGNEAALSAIGDAGESVSAEFKSAEARDQILHLLDQLDDRDRKILMARFGIDRKHEGVPFHVIAKEIGLSTTRTVQLFHLSIEKLRALIMGTSNSRKTLSRPKRQTRIVGRASRPKLA